LDRVIEIDLTSAFRLARAAGTHMIASGRGGRIINITSLLASRRHYRSRIPPRKAASRS